ncbi:Asp-tRNA(Asn)/Glu-tRNA(Gln) amidotransferase subunit GatC [Candidatus Pacearchaeota archaeon]|nr:Asp-tRNA(Asn)/Glu-tRNA(Gln) amidotransferase subunit GatC [Candidatus Pacearchaeota archaeon]
MDIDVNKFANLAKIKLNKEEEKEIQKEVSNFLDYVNLLDDVGTRRGVFLQDEDDMLVMDNITGLKNIFREDEVEKYKGNNLLDNSPLTKDGFFLVPKVIKQNKE